jgi:carboxymethylenebutenolidase
MVLHFPDSDAMQPAISAAIGGKRNVEIYVYRDATPGFYRTGSAGYSRAAASIAYSRTLAMLRKTLGPVYDLSALWEAHRACEFELRDADATMKTMVAEPYVNHVPTMTGGVGQHELHHFYSHHFIPNNPTDTKSTLVSRTVGVDRVVNETVLSFTHDRVIDWLLPGVAPTGRRVEIALIGIITFRGDKLVHEHIYWDQASVLAQVGLLDASRLPVAGAEAARKVMDPSLTSNELMHRHTARAPGA